jgi:arsenate reductase
MAEAFLREHSGERFEAYSVGCKVAEEVHPYTVRVMAEVGLDTSDQYPKGMREYMGKMHFGYLITVCTRAEKECPTVFPGVGLKLTWLFDDLRGAEVPEEERLEKFRKVRDQIEARIQHWLEHPEEEIAKLKAQRERERRERLRARNQESASHNTLTMSEPENVPARLAYS